MLVKSHSNEFIDEVGIISRDAQYVHFMHGDTVNNSKGLKLSPVEKVSARWMYKEIRVKCKVADTISKKRLGLQGCNRLAEDEGMYFPYEDYTDVTFHQGMVPYSLDIIFLRDSQIIGIQEQTVVGSLEKWGCLGCDGVLEVNGGFCQLKGACENDEILINAVSKLDLIELEAERQYDCLAEML